MMKKTDPLVNPHVNSAIKPPADFQWVWNDKHNGGDKDISFWRVIPQPGYVAIGDAHRCLDYRVAIDIVGSSNDSSEWSDYFMIIMTLYATLYAILSSNRF